jgi:magnesium transporter
MRPILSLSFQDLKAEVISELNDLEHAKDIVDLLRYDENSAGIDGKELVKVNENWNVLTCVKEMRIQAEKFLECILSMWSMMKTD